MHHYFLVTLINGGGPPCTIQRLKAISDKMLSTCGFNFNLRRYNMGRQSSAAVLEPARGGIRCGVGSFAFQVGTEGYCSPRDRMEFGILILQ